MTEYMIMFPADDEAAGDARTEAEREAWFESDYEFGRLLEKRGGRMTGGAELAKSRETWVVTQGPNGTALRTRGRYAETAEQLSGFFLVSIDDEDAMLESAEVLVHNHPAVEIRPVASSGED